MHRYNSKQANEDRDKFLNIKIQREFEKTRISSTQQSLINSYNTTILNRKLTFFIGYYSQIYYSTDLFNLKTIIDIQKYSKFEDVKLSALSQNNCEVINEILEHPDLLAKCISIIQETRAQHMNYICISFLPSLFDLFTTEESCIKFLAFLDNLYSLNIKAAYNAAKCVFLSPSFIQFIQSITESLPMDLSMVVNNESAEEFWRDFIVLFKQKAPEMDFLAASLLSGTHGSDYFYNSFLLPAVHSPLVYGLYNLQDLSQNSVERFMIDCIDSINVVQLIFHDFSNTSFLGKGEHQVGDIFSKYSRPLLLTDNDILILSFVQSYYKLHEEKSKVLSFPDLKDGFTLYYFKSSGSKTHNSTEASPFVTFMSEFPNASIPISHPSEDNTVFDTVFNEYILPLSTSKKDFKTRLAFDIIKSMPDNFKKNYGSGGNISKLKKCCSVLEQINVICNNEKEICLIQKDVLRFYFARLYFYFEQSAPKEIPDEIYNYPGKWQEFVISVARNFYTWKDSNKYDGDFPGYIISLFLMKYICFDKFIYSYSWMLEADKIIFDRIDMEKTKIIEYIEQNIKSFEPAISAIRAAYEATSPITTFRIVSNALTSFTKAISSKFQAFGGDESTPVYIFLFLKARPNRFVSWTMFINFIMFVKFRGAFVFPGFESVHTLVIAIVHYLLKDTKYISHANEFEAQIEICL
ncbi:hypothetical protein TVAG_069530 [Trichomonas vaginalis G3]|uniref:VPS9 domain-containing protein n=1 Tax=Trichomonas vaginalis (strain ATCC PRA-98 / G3) TaxID=412133 RepID=A2ELA6_TRIV3|nr:hypothetical protein TVAG_069530 [Trichomonas vaginalis G3]|eukprot:XP_001318806.1 hypothetical protein [Trichomonas vaginalis G3]